MANALGVCLFVVLFCCTNLSFARQVPKECSDGPTYWCQSLKIASDCGAVDHCTATVWETKIQDVTDNEVSAYFIRILRQLKDVKDLINEDYLAARISTACHDAPYPAVARLCKDNTADLELYIQRVLKSNTTPEVMCTIIGMCNNEKVDNVLAQSSKKAEPAKKNRPLLGSAKCTWGPSYWCSDFSSSHECKATHHCLSTVWSKRKYPEDNDSICKICTDMVEEARDQLQSNGTQEDLKQVFEGSCKLIPIQVVTKECMTLADDFVPELVETLSSEMNPQAVCSVAGLCNNAKIDEMLLEHEKKSESAERNTHLVGSAKCTWGPSYWCSNFSSSHECKATHHCVSTVWSKRKYPEDTDSICKICTDMVKQARDQLQSNETQEELKEVFEGSCKLIPIKVVAKECMKLADDFVPELVETLSSEMNPQTVCSVAGLCNNAKIDEMLVEYNARLELRKGCNNCAATVGGLRKKFDSTSYEDFLFGLLKVCQKTGSLSDSCSMLVFKYYENIIEAVKKDLTSNSVCHVSGQCAYKFHSHDEFTFPEHTEQFGDDVPCEFCEQLIKHLRDTMIANTTELEFYKVLQGLCKQTGNFKSECLSLAEQYYPTIYQFLTQELKPQQICAEMGVCIAELSDVIIAPLVPKELEAKAAKVDTRLIGGEEAKIARVPLAKEQTNVRVIAPKPTAAPVTNTADIAGVLPIERMFVSVPQPEGKAVCSFCQYMLHYLQVELSDTTNIERVTEAVDNACNKLPKAVNGECRQFVDEYGPAVVALLVQEIDPSSVCPAIGLCAKVEEVHLVSSVKKGNCPLCLFAVEQLKSMLNNNKSEESIRKALDNLCNRLSDNLRAKCVNFVDTYTEQLVEMLSADLNPQEICVHLKLCPSELHDPLKLTSSIDKFHDKPQLRGDRNNFRKHSLLPTSMLAKDGDIETNEIPDNTVNGRPVKPKKGQKTVCVVCEFVLSEIDDQIKDKHNRDEIMAAVHGVCKRMPKSVRSECDQFVEKYGQMVISLLEQELAPSKVCEELKLCPRTELTEERLNVVKEEILDCAVCEAVVMAVKKVLSNDKVDRDIVHVIEKSCGLLPAKFNARCHTLMEIYGDSVIHLIEDFGVKGVCQKIGLCSGSESAYVRMYRDKRN